LHSIASRTVFTVSRRTATALPACMPDLLICSILTRLLFIGDAVSGSD